jgi:hypothetical protein
MTLKMPDVFTTRHSVSVNEKTHGGRAMVVFRESMDLEVSLFNVIFEIGLLEWGFSTILINHISFLLKCYTKFSNLPNITLTFFKFPQKKVKNS